MRKKLKDEFPAAGAALLAFEASLKIEQAVENQFKLVRAREAATAQYGRQRGGGTELLNGREEKPA